MAFWRDGYQANSVKALSERLGITRSSFYNAFESREAMFMEAFERYLERSPDRAGGGAARRQRLRTYNRDIQDDL